MDSDLGGRIAWIAELRDRLEHGKLANCAAIRPENGAYLRAELVDQLALIDLDCRDGLSLSLRRRPYVVAQRLQLRRDLCRLRGQLG